MKTNDLDLIFIRAQDIDGSWNSFSIKHLLGMGKIGQEQVANWLIQKLVTGIYNMEGEQINEELVMQCVEKLDSLGITVVRINPELLKVADFNDPKKKNTKN